MLVRPHSIDIRTIPNRLRRAGIAATFSNRQMGIPCPPWTGATCKNLTFPYPRSKRFLFLCIFISNYRSLSPGGNGFASRMPSMSRSVFIVDDNSLVRRAVRTTFEAVTDFYVCGEAENGSEAVQQIEQLRPAPDLIILDVAMPVMNGLDAARILSRLMPTVPLILFSNYSDISEDELRSAGVSLHVSKSAPVASLLTAARGVLGEDAA